MKVPTLRYLDPEKKGIMTTDLIAILRLNNLHLRHGGQGWQSHKAQCKDGDIILTTYGDLPLQFYTPSKIIPLDLDHHAWCEDVPIRYGQPPSAASGRALGIDQETAREIFSPFFSTSSSGTGLGLYIAKELSEANGTQLQYIPQESRGTRFRLSFPT